MIGSKTQTRPIFRELGCLATVGVLSIALLSTPTHAQSNKTDIIDSVTFGNSTSEQAHQTTSNLSQTITGGLNQTARILLPRDPQSWDGGSVSFTIAVDPKKQNYVTLRLWGSENSPDRLILFCEGKQIGYRPLGDIETLDFGNDSSSDPCPGRFYYQTTPLPLSMTTGKTLLHCEIRSSGPIWVYGTSFEQYQKPMAVPTRGIYGIYTHTDGYFVPPAGDVQGSAPVDPPVRTGPGTEVLDKLKARVNGAINRALASDKPLGQQEMHLLARAYFVRWTPAYQNPHVVDQIVKGLDALYVAFHKDPTLAQVAPDMYNPDWFGFGFAGDCIQLLSGPLQPTLDVQIDDGSANKVTRRAAWSQMLQASRDWHLRHRRFYSNQTMIVDMNCYTANRGIAAIDPTHALPEAKMRDYLYQSVGLEPWLGSDTATGPEKPYGDNYYEITSKGLTRELGYVGYYGEVLDWVTTLYDVTRPTPDAPGDKQIKAQLIKIAHAREIFRYPAVDADGNRAMRIETIVGWRDTHFPGDVIYAERPTWDASSLYTAATTLDPETVGAVQEMADDNQLFASLEQEMAPNGSTRVTAGLLGVPDQYAVIKAQAPAAKRLPMSAGQPDFAWADEQDGVVAIKHDGEMLYASLYWRARNGVNSLARVHDITQQCDRIAVVGEDAQFTPSGTVYVRPDLVNLGFNNGIFLKYPGDLHSAEAGEELPMAKMPPGVTFKASVENPYAGRADFYALRYGSYVVGMNCTQSKTYSLKLPGGLKSAYDLISGKSVAVTEGEIVVGPETTVVLFLGAKTFR